MASLWIKRICTSIIHSVTMATRGLRSTAESFVNRVLWFNLGMHHVPHTGDLPNVRLRLHSRTRGRKLTGGPDGIYDGPSGHVDYATQLLALGPLARDQANDPYRTG